MTNSGTNSSTSRVTDNGSTDATPVLPALELRPLMDSDLPQILRLDERAFGPGRFARTAYRLRENVQPDYSLSFVAHVGTFLVGSNIMTPISAGGQPALLLGPLTVDPSFRSRGIGEALIRRSLNVAKNNGHRLVFLVGDAPFYSKMGFKPVKMGRFMLPGPVDPARLLACELVEGTLENQSGAISRNW